ncbi:MAG: phospho-sugar mutase [Pirellulales bacterium]
MSDAPTRATEVPIALAILDGALAQGLILPSAGENIRRWLLDQRYREQAPEVARHLAEGRWPILNDVFYTTIPFGTAGRRGRMYPIGSNAIHEHTIGESAQGLADYVRQLNCSKAALSCAIGYDTRHRSREFAELCAEVMAAAGFRVHFLDGPRSTPQLAFTVRHFGCQCGIMISASHNPPQDNAIKVFWSSGGQLRPPHDLGVIACVERVRAVLREPFEQALARGAIEYCQEQIDRPFRQAVLACAFAGPRALRILYSPLHGVGATSVLPVLEADGFRDVELFAPHATLDGDFPNVPGHIANPESPAVFDSLIERANQTGAHLVLASDPDADRIGCAAPGRPGEPWRVFSGNQIAVLLADFIFSRRAAAGSLSPDDYTITTLVTTGMLRAVAEHYGVRVFENVFTGFKWIGSLMDELGPEHFLFGAEEAHGYLVGNYGRDKDAAGAAMLLAELAADCQARGLSLWDHLLDLYRRVGYFAEAAVSRTFAGAAGMAAMQATMERLRRQPPASLAGMRVARVRDYLEDRNIRPKSLGQVIEGRECDLLFFDLESPGNAAAVRPSGTEPKLKCYLFARRPTGSDCAGESQRQEVAQQLARMRVDLWTAAGLTES